MSALAKEQEIPVIPMQIASTYQEHIIVLASLVSKEMAFLAQVWKKMEEKKEKKKERKKEKWKKTETEND